MHSIKPQLPTVEDLKELPLRAIVAFAVRCALRVQPWVINSKLSNHYQSAVDRAIKVAAANLDDEDPQADAELRIISRNDVYAVRTYTAKAYALNTKESNAILYAAVDTARAASDAAFAAYADDTLGEMTLRISDAAHAAAYAASSAAATPGKCQEEIKSAIYGDYRLLKEHAYLDSWSDVTPVPQEVFGSFWPNGIPFDVAKPDRPDSSRWRMAGGKDSSGHC